MSFFGIGRQQPTSEQKLAAVEGEMRMMADTYNRLQKTCQKKCISTDYREAELNKGESVCLDRCTAKFLDTSMKVSEIMQQQGQAMGGGASGGNGGAFS
ncbi:protein transporter tim10 [Claviceps humidiphila]|uniref:Mitochondrial import inner membrane translocase subunit n=1 Tax=Claviceps humidiphila TaxID=1294629 RepID=A0A9P7TX41_9HYPO|nr:protein transporter tim10 [Claviceps humidiphila]